MRLDVPTPLTHICWTTEAEKGNELAVAFKTFDQARHTPAHSCAQAEIPSVKGILVLDGDGKRVVCRYYSSHFATPAEELAFEKRLFDKTNRTNAKTEGAPAGLGAPEGYPAAARRRPAAAGRWLSRAASPAAHYPS